MNLRMYIIYENKYLFLSDNNFKLFLLIIKEFFLKNDNIDEEMYHIFFIGSKILRKKIIF